MRATAGPGPLEQYAGRTAARALGAAAAAARGTVLRLEQSPAWRVVGAAVLVEWLVVVGVAIDVHHGGWLWGGPPDGSYARSVALLHGRLEPVRAGYGWPVLLLPFALVGGSTLAHVLPAIVVVNVLVFLPAATAATYALAARLGGRLFGCGALAVWILLPLLGIAYTNAGFKAQYTQLTLPHGLGLAPDPTVATFAALTLSALLTARVLQGSGNGDAALAGLAAGAGLALEPASAPFLAGPMLAFLAARRLRGAVLFVLALAPFVLVLALWSWRSLGYVPLFHAGHATRLHSYVDLDWSQLGSNLVHSLREHFWSERVVEWVVVAGIVALARLRASAAFLVGGWFAAFVVLRAASPTGVLETGALLRQMLPAAPALVLLVTALPLLVPGVPGRLRSAAAPLPTLSLRARATGAVAALLVLALLPALLAAVATR